MLNIVLFVRNYPSCYKDKKKYPTKQAFFRKLTITHDRDILAANNIKRFALNALRLDQPEVTPTESKSLDPRRSRKPIVL